MHYALYTVPYLNYVPRTLPTLSGVYVTSYSRTHPVPPSSRYPPPPSPPPRPPLAARRGPAPRGVQGLEFGRAPRPCTLRAHPLCPECQPASSLAPSAARHNQGPHALTPPPSVGPPCPHPSALSGPMPSPLHPQRPVALTPLPSVPLRPHPSTLSGATMPSPLGPQWPHALVRVQSREAKLWLLQPKMLCRQVECGGSLHVVRPLTLHAHAGQSSPRWVPRQ